MILPICKAFYCLKTRIECIKITKYEPPLTIISEADNHYGLPYNFTDDFKMEDLLSQFDDKIIIMKNYYIKRDFLRDERFKQEKQLFKEKSAKNQLNS